MHATAGVIELFIYLLIKKLASNIRWSESLLTWHALKWYQLWFRNGICQSLKFTNTCNLLLWRVDMNDLSPFWNNRFNCTSEFREENSCVFIGFKICSRCRVGSTERGDCMKYSALCKSIEQHQWVRCGYPGLLSSQGDPGRRPSDFERRGPPWHFL